MTCVLPPKNHTAKCMSTNKSDPEPDMEPVKFTTSKAATWKAVETRGGGEDDWPWFQSYERGKPYHVGTESCASNKVKLSREERDTTSFQMEKSPPIRYTAIAQLRAATTISEVIPIVNGIKLDMESNQDKSLDPIVKDVLHNLKTYYVNIEGNNLFSFATILDLRFKVDVFSYPQSSKEAKSQLEANLSEEKEEEGPPAKLKCEKQNIDLTSLERFVPKDDKFVSIEGLIEKLLTNEDDAC
uniref:(California timema) hypothetical protein n=1 Tax=Timema californicum TaxID=61474 RepID=A0A7R9J4G1_TIMCA|nr:unnamed protein product [Timema californicum]